MDNICYLEYICRPEQPFIFYHVFWRLTLFYTHLLMLLLQPSVLWLSTVMMMQSHRQGKFCANLMYHESALG